MAKSKALVPQQRIENSILLIRGHKALLDADLAALYGVPTKRLNEQVKRNKNRFPPDFMFRLSQDEKTEVVANCDHLKNLKYSRSLPCAFTEHGAIMAANVINSERAIEISVYVVRAFVKLREDLAEHKKLARKIVEIEKKYDSQFKVVFDALRRLMAPPSKAKKKIGFTE